MVTQSAGARCCRPRKTAINTPRLRHAERGVYLSTAELVFKYVWRVETPFIVGLLSLAVPLVSGSMAGGRFGRLIPLVGLALCSVPDHDDCPSGTVAINRSNRGLPRSATHVGSILSQADER
jgi:hypothetical protein